MNDDEIDNDDDEPQAPSSLREIAEQGTKSGSADPSRRERERLKGPGYGYTPDGDLVLERDEKGVRWYSDERKPIYRDEQEAAESLALDRRDEDEQRHEDAKQQLEDYEHNWKSAQQYHAGWNSPEERTALSDFTQRMQRQQQHTAHLQQNCGPVTERVRALNEAGHHVEAQILAKGFIDALNAHAKEEAELVALTKRGQQHQAKKERDYAVYELARLCPGIQDHDTRERFKRWAEKEYRIPRYRIEAETDPAQIAPAYRDFLKSEREGYEQLARKRIAAKVNTTRGTGSATTSKDARQELRQRGRMDDALAFLNLRKMEKRYGL